MAHIDISDESEVEHQERLSRSWYIGAYVTRRLKKQLHDEARQQGRSQSQQLIFILTGRYAAQEKENNGT